MNVTLDQARALDAFARAAKAPTRTLLSVDSLDGVAARFKAEVAQLMVTVLPVDASPSLEVHRLPKLRARLVAHKSHPLSRLKKVTRKALAEHVLLTVRGSDPRLHLATAELDTQSMVHLLDFHAKKDAIVAGLGFGWLPDWLIERELQRGKLSPQAPAGQRSRLRARGRRAVRQRWQRDPVAAPTPHSWRLRTCHRCTESPLKTKCWENLRMGRCVTP